MSAFLCPYIRRAWYHTMNPGDIIPTRVIFDYELLLVKSGFAKIVIENKQYSAVPGDLFIFRPKQKHAIYVATNVPFVQPHVHFDLEYYADREIIPISFKDLPEMNGEELAYFRNDILDKFLSPFPSVIHPHNVLYIEQLLFEIINSVENPKIYNEIHILGNFFKLWEQILLEAAYSSKSLSKQNDLALAMKNLIERNDSTSLSLDEIAEIMHFSKGYLERTFKEAFGTSPFKYHASLRIQKAKRMISFTNMSLSEVADSLGFDSLQSFSRTFKSIDGSPPSAYRK